MNEEQLKRLLESDPEGVKRRLLGEKLRRSLPEFARAAWPILEPGTKMLWGWPLDAICDHLEAVSKRQIKRLVINVPPGPMREDSIVTTEHGKRELRSIKVGDKVLTHKGRFRKVTAVHDQGILPIYKITAAGGRITYAAGSHPYLTQKGWVEAKDLDKEKHLLFQVEVEKAPRWVEMVENPETNVESARCMCLTVEEDHSFVCSDIAVKNSMKSLLTGPFFSAWEWTHSPYSRFIRASYSAHLAERDTMKARRIITSEWYTQLFPSVKLMDDQGGKTNFANTHAGSMFATSVGGVGTGERGNYFMIDDPHSIQKAESPADRARTLHWFGEVVPSRLNNLDDDCIVVIMQRVHEDDVTGYALSSELGYEHLCIPMHYDPARAKTTSIGWSDPRTEDGELMWEERFSQKAINALMTGLGPYGTACQLDQYPVPREGGMFLPDRIRVIEDVEASRMKKLVKVRAWDLAGTEKRGAYTVGILMGHEPDTKQYYILDIRREQLSPGRVRELIKRIAEQDGPSTTIVLPQDPGQAGKGQVQEYIQELAGYVVKAELQSGSKELRAEALAAQVDIGAVSALERHWLKSFLDELRMFPRGKFKDQVDAASSAFNQLARMSRRKNQSALDISGERLTLFSGL